MPCGIGLNMAKLSTFLLYISIFSFSLAGGSLAGEQALQKRQDEQTSDVVAITTVSSPGRISTTIVTSTSSRQTTARASTSQPSPTTTRPASAATSRQTTQESASGPTTTRNPPSTTSQDEKPGETASGSNNDSTSDSDRATAMTTLSPTTRRQVTTIYSTITSGGNTGQVSAILSTSTTVETPTVPASSGGQNQGQNNGSEGLKPATRNTIIGAVLGVGGALLVGGLVIFAWRLKKRRVNPVDEDDLMRRDGSSLAAGRDKRTASPEESPFKATLDQYHKPPGTVNASSNF